jgi:hypothetical protein
MTIKSSQSGLFDILAFLKLGCTMLKGSAKSLVEREIFSRASKEFVMAVMLMLMMTTNLQDAKTKNIILLTALETSNWLC